jgi:hypothetical protein
LKLTSTLKDINTRLSAKAGGRVVFYPDYSKVLLHTRVMECCCRTCSFNRGTAVRGDGDYAAVSKSTVPETEKFEGSAQNDPKYGDEDVERY